MVGGTVGDEVTTVQFSHKKTPRWRAGSEEVWGTDMTGVNQSVSDH